MGLSTTASFRDKKDFDLVTADLGQTINERIEQWLHETIRVNKDATKNLFTSKVPEWRRLAEGKPREKNKSFPWQNCSNLVVQVIGSNIDDISARVMGLVWSTSPVSVFRYFHKSENPEDDERKRAILEQFMDSVSYEPDDLDLYRIENMWFSDAARLGTAFVKVYPDKRVSINVTGYDAKSKRTMLEQSESYNTPKVDKIRFEHVLADINAPTWDKSRIKIHIRQLTRHELDERAFAGFFDKDKVESIRNKPDRHGPTTEKQREMTKKGITPSQDATILAEWDVFECYFWWFVNVRSKTGKSERVKVDLIWSYHYSSRTVLRQVFNFMPDNACPIIPTKLSISDEGVYGRGYADLLENFQEEISTQHNQRIDARTMANIGIFASSNPNIDKNFEIFPSCVVPFSPDEFAQVKMSTDIGDGGLQEEELALRLAAQRAGIDPAVTGMGAGSANKKGQYGSMGTLAIMQDGNTRVNHRVSDFRHSHVKLMSMCTAMYGKFGGTERAEMFGIDENILKEALSDYESKKVRIPIRAATASTNIEVSKQNDMLLRNALSQHNVEQAKLIQAIAQGGNMPPEAKAWMMKVCKSQDLMMKKTLRNFGFDNPDLYVPEMEFSDGKAKQQQQPQPGRSAAGAVAPQPQPEQGQGATPNGGAGVPAIAQGLGETPGGAQ